MGTFTATERISRIEWDFTKPDEKTGFVLHDKNDKPFPAEIGVGTLPEPTPEATAEYLDVFRRILEKGLAHGNKVRDRLGEADASGADNGETFGTVEIHVEMTEMAKSAMVDLGVPKALVDLMPGRMVGRFSSWLREELSGEGDAVSLTD